MRAFRPCVFLLLLALIPACAKGPEKQPASRPSPRASETWERFRAVASRMEAASGPFRLNATLYYSGKEDSQRVTVYFWGNASRENALPLRMDILMGPGSVMAAMREDERGLFIYAPRDNLVYHADSDGLPAFGMPVPFTLADLAALVAGRFADVFIPEADSAPAGVEAQGQDAVEYSLADAPLPGVLALSPFGLPVAWAAQDGNWRLDIDYWPDSTRASPRKLHISNRDGKEATLIVRELGFPDAAFTDRQLELGAPAGTRLVPLEPAQ